ncbi:MAG TPA: ATP-dependent helicase, partial [Thermoanaerobaculia bacterium]|nr:ATP-dependent helicase [Thermoanaerobaculia bacterium]
MNLTDAQRAAIAHRGGNLQLIACAGSGKTEVVAQRVAALLSPNPGPALQPANIVAFTFTEKAAAELKDRIVARCREQLGEVVGLAEMYVGTIHAFALDLLKGEVPEYLKYEVLNEVQQHLFVDRHSKESGLTVATDLNGAQLKRYQDTERYVDALNILREDDGWDETGLAGNPVLGGLDAYRNLLARKGYLDYSALLDIAVTRLTNDEELKARIAERVKHVIVDEYQDVNPIQEALVWLLSELGADLTVVGDDDQTIYQWRGSAVRNILNFAGHYSNVTTVPLVENFRSSRGVVETAREVIARNSVRLPKEMQPADAQDDEAGDLVALTFADPDEEARFIAETCRELRGLAIREDGGERGISWSDMAVLLRSVKANGAPVTKALRAAGIPFVVIGM